MIFNKTIILEKYLIHEQEMEIKIANSEFWSRATYKITTNNILNSNKRKQKGQKY